MLTRMSTKATFILPLLVALVLLGSTAFAHAVLIEAAPSPSGAVAGPDVEFRLRFNSRIDPARSALKLVLPDGNVQSLQLSPQTSPGSVSAKSTQMKTGHYLLRWQVLAVDGHITRGEIPFDVR